MVDWALFNGGACEDGSSYAPCLQDQTPYSWGSQTSTEPAEPRFGEGVKHCAMCGTVMVERDGRFGMFLACPNSTKAKPHPTQGLRS